MAKPAKKKPAKRAAKAPAKKTVKHIPSGDDRKKSKSKFEAVPAPAAEPSLDELLVSLPMRQRVFVTEYLANGFNATGAAKAAGYSAHTADSQASRLLTNVKVAAIVKGRAKTALAKREITAARVLDEIAKLAFFDPRRFYDDLGNLIPVHKLDEECGAALAGVDVRELYADKSPVGQLKKIKFADKGQNLERLGRYLKLFTDKVETTLKIERVLVEKAVKQKRKLPPTPEF